jgi:YD repeat-containing protein
MENYRIQEQFYDHPDSKEVGINLFFYNDNGFLEKIFASQAERKEETRCIYNKDCLLISMETYKNGEKKEFTMYNYENSKMEVIKEMTTYDANNNIIDYYYFIFENNIRIRTKRYSMKNNLEYEYIHQYENNKRLIRTLNNNATGEFSTREYDEKGLLKRINMSSGGVVTFIWECGYTNYDFDKYYLN